MSTSIATRIAEIMAEIEEDGGPTAWTFDTRGNVTLTPESLADLIAWAAKSSKTWSPGGSRADAIVGEIMKVADA